MFTTLSLLLSVLPVVASGFFVASEFTLAGVPRSRAATRAAAFTSAAARTQTPAPEPVKPVSEEQALMAQDLAWHQAVAAHDAEALGRLLADDYRFDLDASRVLTKAQEIEAVKSSAPPFDFGPFRLRDVSARIEGERATVTGTLTVRQNGGDKNSRRRYFYARTLVRRDGRWQILSAGLVTLWPDGD